MEGPVLIGPTHIPEQVHIQEPVFIQDQDIIRSSQYGGATGGAFDDAANFAKNHARIIQIEVRADNLVRAIYVTFSDGQVLQHGGYAGTLNTFILEDDEKITSVSGRYGGLLDQITFNTSKGRTFGPCGGSGGGAFSVDFGVDRHLLYLFGRKGVVIDAIGFAYGPDPLVESGVVHKGEAFGVDGGVQFDNKIPGAKITAVHIRHGLRIDAIQIQYDGKWAERRGGSGGDPNTVYMPGDHLSKITGTYDTTLRSIRLHTLRGWTSREYGVNAGTPFTIYKEGCVISGIHGSHGTLLEKLGGYLQVYNEEG